MTQEQINELRGLFKMLGGFFGKKYIKGDYDEAKMDKKESLFSMIGSKLQYAKAEAEELLGVGILEAAEQAA